MSSSSAVVLLAFVPRRPWYATSVLRLLRSSEAHTRSVVKRIHQGCDMYTLLAAKEVWETTVKYAAIQKVHQTKKKRSRLSPAPPPMNSRQKSCDHDKRQQEKKNVPEILYPIIATGCERTKKKKTTAGKGRREATETRAGFGTRTSNKGCCEKEAAGRTPKEKRESEGDA